MIEHCRAKGLENVHLGDAVGYVEGLPDHSLQAIFGAQVIEHLPYEGLVRFLRAANDKLSPSGLLVVETVNPHAPQGLKHFWIDPTHRHPLFPRPSSPCAGSRGFAGAFIGTHRAQVIRTGTRSSRLDYAVVAEASARPARAPGRAPRN